MSAGRPISLLGGTTDGSEYDQRSSIVRTIYQTTDARHARDLALSLHIDYLWVDRIERGAYAAGVAKFDAAPQWFAPVFRNREVTVFRVH
jgi:uncharacterized membrane protein